MSITTKEKVILGGASMVFVVGMSVVVLYVLSFANNDFNRLSHLSSKVVEHKPERSHAKGIPDVVLEKKKNYSLTILNARRHHKSESGSSQIFRRRRHESTESHKAVEKTEQLNVIFDFGSNINWVIFGDALKNLLQESLTKAAIQNFADITVEPQVNTIKLTQKECFLAKVDEKYITTGLRNNVDGQDRNAHLVIFVTFSNDPNFDYMAWSSVCAVDAKGGNRPVAAQLNINIYNFQPSVAQYTYQLNTIKREIIHILGFSNQLYKYYRGADGKQLKIEDVLVKSQDASFIKLPGVVAWAQKYFDCPSLTQVQLDTYSIDNFESQWHPVLLKDEIMQQFYNAESVLSGITFTLLQETGWYETNPDIGQDMTWGKAKGCKFTGLTCDPSIEGFCDGTQLNQQICLPKSQLISTCRQLGSLKCYWLQPNFDGNCVQETNAGGIKTDLLKMSFGSSSKCFESTIITKGQKSNSIARCHRFKCDTVNSQVVMLIDGKEIPCKNGKATPDAALGLDGEVKCRAFEDLCVNDPCGGCNGHGTCKALVLGEIQTIKCICAPGYIGENCETERCVAGCFGNGVCQNDKCKCNNGFSGNACQFKQVAPIDESKLSKDVLQAKLDEKKRQKDYKIANLNGQITAASANLDNEKKKLEKLEKDLIDQQIKQQAAQSLYNTKVQAAAAVNANDAAAKTKADAEAADAKKGLDFQNQILATAQTARNEQLQNIVQIGDQILTLSTTKNALTLTDAEIAKKAAEYKTAFDTEKANDDKLKQIVTDKQTALDKADANTKAAATTELQTAQKNYIAQALKTNAARIVSTIFTTFASQLPPQPTPAPAPAPAPAQAQPTQQTQPQQTQTGKKHKSKTRTHKNNKSLRKSKL